MGNYIAVTPKNIGTKCWTPPASYLFASKYHIVPIATSEITKIVRDIPLAFVRQDNQYTLVAVLSVISNNNMYVDLNGNWLGTYIPTYISTYPFRLSKIKDRDNYILCIDTESGLISDTTGDPIFSFDGYLSSSVKNVQETLKNFQQSIVKTDFAVSSLAESGVITGWRLNIKTRENDNIVSGLYRVDEQRLNALDNETYLNLRKTQAIPIAYAQLFSVSTMPNLGHLARQREYTSFQQPFNGDTSVLFDDDELIKFD